jgi:hypothetical protein
LEELPSEYEHFQVSFEADIRRLLAMRKVHFPLESGHHGDLWLDLELPCLRPKLVRPVRGTFEDSQSGGARVAGIGALLILGAAAASGSPRRMTWY